MDKGLNRAAAIAGSRTALAEALGVDKAAVSQWSRVPIHRAVEIERLFGVPVEELRPDLAWVRIPDPEWANGRPAHDLTLEGEATA